MGASSRLKFPLPHRRQKQKQQQQQQEENLSISAPMTNKAQKLLGTADINIDISPTSPSEPAKAWETHSAFSGVSGISITVSESTAPGTTSRATESTITAGTKGGAKAAQWDQESDIIPKGLNLSGSGAGRNHIVDAMTDASSLRRRGSSSTIVSYYDKSKLPLSISQQTSSSAMAKGLPNKAADPLDMECPRPAPLPPKQEKKKPSRLDLSHLLSGSASSRFARFTHKGSMVLGPDLLTRSPSVMSTSPAMSTAEFDPKPHNKIRKKLTKESLRSLSSPRSEQRLSTLGSDSRSSNLRKRATDTGDLNYLYEHYEKTSIRDTMTQEDMELAVMSSRRSSRDADADADVELRTEPRRDSRPSVTTSSPSTNNRTRHHISPSFSSVSWRPSPSYVPDEDCGPIAENPNPRTSMASSSLTSPPTDYAASVSSRHTRTSKATQKTEQSFADFDPNATSVLSLSSDSEDDDPVPSITSRDSITSIPEHRRPNTSVSQESGRSQSRSRFRTSLNSQVPFLSIPEHARSSTTPSPPTINPRSSSLVNPLLTNSGQRPSFSTTASSVRSPSRLSQVSTTSTSESASTHFSRPRPSVSGSASSSSPRQVPEVRHVAMLSRAAAPAPRKHSVPNTEQQNHVTPQSRLVSTSQDNQPTPPLSPSSMEFVIRSQYDSNNEQGGPILTLNGTGHAEDERFMAVTRQEEMLLAAMRAKRALMRENLHIADIVDLDRDDGTSDKTASKKESLSSIKTVTASTRTPTSGQLRPHSRTADRAQKTLTMGFPEPPSARPNSTQPDNKVEIETESHEQVLMCLDRTISTMNPYDMSEPSPDLSDFIIDFDADQFPSPPRITDGHGLNRGIHSRTSSAASIAGQLTQPKPLRHHRKHSLDRPRPDSEFMPRFRPMSEDAPPLPSPHGVDLKAGAAKGTAGSKSAQEQTTSESQTEEPGPELSTKLPEEVVEKPRPVSRKKAVRISAVGLQHPEMGQWGDDG